MAEARLVAPYQVVCVTLLALLGPLTANAQFFRAEDTRTKPPELWFPWTRQGLDLQAGGSYLSGNIRETGYSGSLNYLQKLAPQHQIMIEGAEDYNRFNDVKVMDKTRGSLLYAYGMRPHWNAYAVSTHGQNRFTQIRYRTTDGGGLCYHSFLPEIFNPILVSAGPVYEYEAFFNGLERRTVRANPRISFGLPLTRYVNLGTDFWYLPSLEDFHNYRLFSEVYLQFKVTEERVSFRMTWSDEYDSRPFPGIKPNDSSLSYSLVLHLGK